MRRVLAVVGFAAAFGLAACDSKPDAPVAPPAPKSMARSQQMYAGQELIEKVDTATISVSSPGNLAMNATGQAAAPGYRNASFLPRINAAPPPNGIYEVDVVADKPAAAGPATPIEVKGAWPYPVEHLKGVKFIAKTNSVVAMLPPS